MSHPSGIDGRSGGRFGAATPGARPERARIDDLVAMGGSRPAATRRRRVITPWRMAALIAAIIVAGGTYALGRYVIAPKPPKEVHLAVTTASVAEGDRFTSADFHIVTLRRSSVPSGALSPEQATTMNGHIAKAPIPRGTILTAGMLSGSTMRPASNQALVGLALKPGQMPAGGLAVGQKGTLLLLQVSSQGLSLGSIRVREATVWEVLPPDASGAEEVTVLVPFDRATTIASYAARGQVSMFITSASPGS
jgi:hypothetical protein